MNKSYGICLTDCDIIGEIKDLIKLKITDLVQVVFKEGEKKYSIKLRDESGGPGPLKFNQTIYSCNSNNICIVENNLIPFLVDTDFEGRLNVLRFKKKILKLKVGSKGKLQVIYKNGRYFIECVVRHIGNKDMLRVGYCVFVELMDYDFHGDTLYKQLFKKYKNEFSPTWITIRVELLFTEIELSDLSNELEGFSSISDHHTTRFPNFGKDKMHIGIDLLRNDNQEAMDIDHNNLVGEQNYYNIPAHSRGSFSNLENRHNNAMVANMLANSKGCMTCSKLVDVFTFPCHHKLCYECILNQIQQVKLLSPACCPICINILDKHQLTDLHKFLINLEENEKQKFPNDEMNISNEYSKNDETKFAPSDTEMNKTHTDNPVEVPSCYCGTSRKNSANNSCSLCKRSLIKPSAFKPY